MSIKIMTHVWECASLKDQAQLLVMLALADFSNDHGECFPAVATLAEEHHAFRHERLLAVGELLRHEAERIEARVAVGADFLQSDGGFGETDLGDP